MHIERHLGMLHPELVDGRFRCTAYISNYCDEDLDEHLLAWHGDDECAVSNHFWLSDALDSAIELHEMPYKGGAIDENVYDLFAAMRKELVAMIARIDSLSFSPSKRTSQPHQHP
jgi:hypothetical protein